MGKSSIFQNNKVENFKNLEILQSKRDFFNFLQAIPFGTFMLGDWNFLHMFYTGMEHCSKVNNQTVIG